MIEPIDFEKLSGNIQEAIKGIWSVVGRNGTLRDITLKDISRLRGKVFYNNRDEKRPVVGINLSDWAKNVRLVYARVPLGHRLGLSYPSIIGIDKGVLAVAAVSTRLGSYLGVNNSIWSSADKGGIRMEIGRVFEPGTGIGFKRPELVVLVSGAVAVVYEYAT